MPKYCFVSRALCPPVLFALYGTIQELDNILLDFFCPRLSTKDPAYGRPLKLSKYADNITNTKKPKKKLRKSRKYQEKKKTPKTPTKTKKKKKC